MEEIIVFKAKDGVRFDSYKKCYDHELVFDEINKILETLPKNPEDCDFSNGGGYLQHNRNNFIEARKRILVLSKIYIKHKWIDESIQNPEIDSSWAGRLISDCCPNVINNAWYRITCTSKDFKEYGQPFYVSHQDQAKNICLNQQ